MHPSRVVSLAIAGVCLSTLAGQALADARTQATAECRKAVQRQGHENARFDTINAMEGRDSIAVIGEMTSGDKRYAFRCNFDKSRKLTDAPISELPASGATATK